MNALVSEQTISEGGETRNGAAEPIPPLRAGDRLSVEEFERRYWAMPDVNKAELINGVVYMPSPVSDDFHGRPHADLMGALGIYRFNTPGVLGGDNSTLKMGRHRPQPDGFLRIDPACGGQTRTEDGYVIGAPELIAEVAYSSASYDLYDKKEAYREGGVQEYLVWRAEDQMIDWFRLRGVNYVPLDLSEGILKSEVFPGLWLDPAALLRADFARLQQVLQSGLASPEHQRFLDELARKRSVSPTSE